MISPITFIYTGDRSWLPFIVRTGWLFLGAGLIVMIYSIMWISLNMDM